MVANVECSTDSQHCRSSKPQSDWRGTWRSTFLGKTPSKSFRIDCEDVYSDVLYRPFYCAKAPLAPFCSMNIPERNVIPRFSDMHPLNFKINWASKPFILTSPVKQWPIFNSWSIDHLLENYGSTVFRAECVDWTLEQYVQYMSDNEDESPLYLFDKSFKCKMSLEKNAYQPPDCFGDDLFDTLGKERPDHAWLIIGPERGGSTFHKDVSISVAVHQASDKPIHRFHVAERHFSLECCDSRSQILGYVSARRLSARSFCFGRSERGHQPFEYNGMAARVPRPSKETSRLYGGHLCCGRSFACTEWVVAPRREFESRHCRDPELRM